MAENSKIEWTDHTFNAWVGCTKIKGKNGAPSACDFCYAEAWAKRAGHPDLWNGKRRRTTESYWQQPIKWNAAAEKTGKRARVFCCSLADVFDNQAEPQWRADLFALIRATPWLEWQLLTKRPQNILKMAKAAGELPRNAALGTTTENQKEADRRIPHLLKAAALLHPLYTFISAEPLLGQIDIVNWLHIAWQCSYCQRLYAGQHKPTCPGCGKLGGWTGSHAFNPPRGQVGSGIGWVICGGESGGKARPMHPEWARSLYQQCKAAGVPFLFKQWGEWLPGHHYTTELREYDSNLEESRFRCMDWNGDKAVETSGIAGWDDLDDHAMWRVGKKRAGRILDGVTHDGFPAPTGKQAP